jgi:predicted phosphoribosyltransferase
MFRDRTDAGRQLATRLTPYASRAGVVVLGLPRGGVPVAAEVAAHLGAPLDVFVVRKLGVPGHEELAMGAIASGGARVLNDNVVAGLGIPASMVEMVTRQEQAELERRERLYRGDRGPVSVRERIVILVDDGLATGASMRAAVTALRAREPAYLVVAVPVGAPETCAAFAAIADEVVCAVMPPRLVAVGLWYDDFGQTTDEEVRDLLDRAAARLRHAA